MPLIGANSFTTVPSKMALSSQIYCLNLMDKVRQITSGLIIVDALPHLGSIKTALLLHFPFVVVIM